MLRTARTLLLAAVAVVPFLATAAGAQTAGNGTFRVGSTSVRPGRSITVRGETPCTLPSGVTGAPFVSVSLARERDVLGRADVQVAQDGSWSGQLTVSAGAAPGPAQLSAFCIASPQAEGAVLEYDQHTITVTDEDLAFTGPRRDLARLGMACLVAGLALLAATRRRARTRMTRN